jgi:hypothetical protein
LVAENAIFQIPPDLVVKSQGVDIVDIIFRSFYEQSCNRVLGCNGKSRAKASRRNNVPFHSACIFALVPEHFPSSITPCLQHLAA